jgi:urate oxidase
MDVDGKPHPHSFVKPGSETRDVQVDVIEGKGIDINSSINGLTVLKSTGSQFWGFLRDEYTTLKETWDRILSTDVAASWQWRRFTGLPEVKAHFEKFTAAWEAARAITLKTFAEENSPSVQATMYKMGEQILAAAPLVETVEYALPNNHYFEVGMFSEPFRCRSRNSWTWTNRCDCRSQLAQGPQEHRQGCRGLRAPVQPQRPYQVHRCPCWPEG